jgi:hypothetical protein
MAWKTLCAIAILQASGMSAGHHLVAKSRKQRKDLQIVPPGKMAKSVAAITSEQAADMGKTHVGAASWFGEPLAHL